MVDVRSVCNFLVELIVILLRIIYCYAEALFRFVVPRRPKDIRGKVVVVTGAGGGIGRALATRLAASGACIAVWDINTVRRWYNYYVMYLMCNTSYNRPICMRAWLRGRGDRG